MEKETKENGTIKINDNKCTILIKNDGHNISITERNTIESEKMGYQPTDKLDTSNPPTGNPPKK